MWCYSPPQAFPCWQGRSSQVTSSNCNAANWLRRTSFLHFPFSILNSQFSIPHYDHLLFINRLQHRDGIGFLGGFPLVDCQLPNDHLMSLGATTLARQDFLSILQQEIKQPMPDWAALKNTVHLTYNDN